jgi:hypothetical protein
MTALSIRTKAIVVEISRPSVPLSSVSNADSGGTARATLFLRRAGTLPPIASIRARRYFISGLSSDGR